MRMKVAAGVTGLLASALARAASAETPAQASEPEVEVRGEPLTPDQGSLDPSVAGSTVRRTELTRPGLSAADVLRTEVGTSVTETGGLGATATASIRGATSAQTPVYLGGVRMNDDVAGTADLSTLPLWLVERVEIYRGNAPFEADRFGIGGAIFFEPRRPHDTRAAFGASFGSFGSGGAWAYGTAGNDERALLLGVSLEGAQNDYRYRAGTGTPEDPSDDRSERLGNADATLLDLWLIGRTNVGRGHVELLANRFVRDQGAQRLAVVPTYESRLHLERSLVSIVGRAPLGRSAALELRTTGLVALSALSDPKTELTSPLGAAGTRLEQLGERFEQEISGSLDVDGNTRVRVALRGGSERLRRYEAAEVPGIGPLLDVQRMSGRVAGSAEHDLFEWLSLRALLALECEATSSGGTERRCDSLEPVGRLGALARSGSFSGFVGVGRYARPPTLGELHGTSLAVHGNPTLVAESGATLDIGARYASALPGERRPLYVSTAAYVRRATDLVTFVLTSQDYVTPQNLGVADVAGLELEGGFGFGRYFAADLGVTLLDFRDRSPARTLKNDILPYHSRLIFAPQLEAATPHLGRTLNDASLGARLVYQSNRYADPAGTKIIPEQTSLDVDASLAWLERTLFLRGRVTDVLDGVRYDVVGFPLPGRSFFASLELRLDPR
jgi:iron complex outermembrane receptor protein